MQQKPQMPDTLDSFTSDGFQVDADDKVNTNTEAYAAWCWKTQGGAGSANTAGSINTTTTSVGQTQGFSISKFTGTGSNATIGHGIGIAPHFVIVKKTSGVQSWSVFHIGNTSAPETERLYLDTTAATADSDVYWQDTLPSTTLITLGDDDDVNTSSATYVAYAWAPVQGFSKFGGYTGNGNVDGAFVYLGFRPAWVVIKRTDSTNNWLAWDNKRLGYNPDNDGFLLQTEDTAETNDRLDFVSNGFKIRSTSSAVGASAATFVYMAFAEAPFVNSNGVPNNAR